MFSTTDTIAAIATPAGRGGIGIVRLSGPDAHDIACRLLGRSQPLRPRRAIFGRIGASHTNAVSDQVVATFFRAPHSYTAQDIVELSAHGSPVVLAGVLEAAVRAGARLAQPGEFTFRAFINGRIDLTQAEAVADLIEAVTPLQARAAFDQLEGSLAGAIGRISERLFDLVARLEASLDFPEEGYHFAEPGETAQEIGELVDAVRGLLRRSTAGRVIREGCRVVISGRPNVGKSSLFNALLSFDRAIVDAAPGTTRDLLAESIDLSGVPVMLVDSAGIRDVPDDTEAEGVRRARRAAHSASLVLLVLDRSEPLTPTDRVLLDEASGRPRLLVASKADLPPAWMVAADPTRSAMPVSAQTGEGVEELRTAIAMAVGHERDTDEPPRVTNVRHISLLQRTEGALARAADALTAAGGALPEEVVLLDLAEARSALEEITGTTTTDDLLDRIFARFCVGK